MSILHDFSSFHHKIGNLTTTNRVTNNVKPNTGNSRINLLKQTIPLYNHPVCSTDPIPICLQRLCRKPQNWKIIILWLLCSNSSEPDRTKQSTKYETKQSIGEVQGENWNHLTLYGIAKYSFQYSNSSVNPLLWRSVFSLSTHMKRYATIADRQTYKLVA